MNKVRLGDILEITSSKRIFASDYVSSGIPFYRGKEIAQMERGENITDLLFISREKYEKLKENYPVPKKGDILLTSVGSIGIPYLICNEEFYFKDGNLTWFRNFSKRIDSKFLYYWMLSEEFKKQIFNNRIGAVQNALTIIALQDLKINLPDISTQIDIACFLSSIDNKIELNNKINEELENLAKTIYEYWFVQNADENWEKGKLSEIANITMGQSPDGSSYNEQGEGIIFFQGCTDFGARFPVIRQYTTKPARFAEVGDILLSVRAPVGVINFANKKCCIGRGLAALNSKISSITHLYFILKNLEKVFNRSNTGGTTFGAITKDDLFSLSVTIPPRNILVKYEEIAKPIFEKQLEIEEESSTLALLRDFLLPLLMNGQVKVKNG